jgi:CRP-like cAMP-binding protein
MWSAFWPYPGPDFPNGRRPLFSNLSEPEQRRVISQGVRRFYRPKQIVFRQGAHHGGIYLILSGSVRTFFVSPAGREITFAFWTDNYYVGGPEVFGGGSHLWSGSALEPSEILYLPADELLALCTEMPAFGIFLIDSLSLKGACFSNALQFIATRSAKARLCCLILSLRRLRDTRNGELANLPASLTHQQIASMIGVTRQWVSQSLHRLEERGMITLADGQLAVLDESALKREAVE